uniref:Dolichyl-diphosphooligosaccharide--protein glycosyltransferase subunit DAD1 n=1 Tax=Sinocyclocheilus grahami TaxID=75366 RepID=A0A672T8L5_SINGR
MTKRISSSFGRPNKVVSLSQRNTQLIDAYLLYIMMTGALQFISQHVSFQQLFFWFHIVLCLRVQINPQNKVESLSISPERAFADFQFAHTVLHLVVINFIG